MKRTSIFIFLLAILSPAGVHAQDSLSRSITVIINDSMAHETVLGAVVTLLTSDGEYVASSVTDVNGFCMLNDVLPDIYKLKVEYIGAKRIVHIIVKDDMLVRVNLPKVQATVCYSETDKGYTSLDNDSYGGAVSIPQYLLQNLMP